MNMLLFMAKGGFPGGASGKEPASQCHARSREIFAPQLELLTTTNTASGRLKRQPLKAAYADTLHMIVKIIGDILLLSIYKENINCKITL